MRHLGKMLNRKYVFFSQDTVKGVMVGWGGGSFGEFAMYFIIMKFRRRF